ncbi:ABC transporter permease [Saccharopolyspora gregorii]|uniref:ABC transporter permease n=1 Tax=Saccharopolyspora gregorii TaxID=33914 RepID=UPI0021ACEC03|nr:ABC transporter permease subunit [Saccharopolyspora gregorii]
MRARRRAALVAAGIGVAVLGVGLTGDPLVTDMGAVLRAPSLAHPLGTDELGRDVLARLAHGALLTLGTAGSALVVAVLLGLLAGCATGWSSSPVAALVRAGVDVATALPPLIVALVTTLIAGPSTAALLLALAGVSWLPFARQADAMTAQLRTRNWVLAHRALGAGRLLIWRRSLLPFLAPAAGALAAVRLPALVNTVAALGFLGLGPPPPRPEWGAMIAESVDHLGTAPWLLAAPVLALVAVQTIVAALAAER